MRAPKTRIPNMPGDPRWKRISDRRHAFNAWRRSERKKWKDHPAASDRTLQSISIPYAGGRNPESNVPAAILEADRRYKLRMKDVTPPDVLVRS